LKYISKRAIMDQLLEIRKAAAEKYSIKKNEPVIAPPKKEGLGSQIPVVSYIYCKNPSGYFVYTKGVQKIEDLIYDHPFCALGLGKNRPISEFGKSVNSGYIKTITGNIYRINDKTFLIPFTQLGYF